jgi:hypothetical protein
MLVIYLYSAVYLHFNNVKFENVSKKEISNYKGYLRSGNHLKDLDKIRGECMNKTLGIGKTNSEATRASLRHGKETGGLNTPR